MGAFAVAGRIASGAAEIERSQIPNGDGGFRGNPRDDGLEARLEALQEALATKVAELARVSSERTALQLRCDKQDKAAREQELCAAHSPQACPLRACLSACTIALGQHVPVTRMWTIDAPHWLCVGSLHRQDRGAKRRAVPAQRRTMDQMAVER